MNFISIYFILALFVGFFFIYITNNKIIIIEKKQNYKNKLCINDKCY